MPMNSSAVILHLIRNMDSLISLSTVILLRDLTILIIRGQLTKLITPACLEEWSGVRPIH